MSNNDILLGQVIATSEATAAQVKNLGSKIDDVGQRISKLEQKVEDMPDAIWASVDKKLERHKERDHKKGVLTDSGKHIVVEGLDKKIENPNSKDDLGSLIAELPWKKIIKVTIAILAGSGIVVAPWITKILESL